MKQIFILLFLCAQFSVSHGQWKLVWSDEFNTPGQPDPAKWGYDIGGHGWGNGEKQLYTRADTNNAVVRGGSLFITARQTSEGKYTSARLLTKNKGDWKYGRIEVRAKLPKGRGIWPAIWMLPTDWAYGDWPSSGEIDIMEFVGYLPDSLYATVHTEAYNHSIGTQKTRPVFLPGTSEQFHVYAVEWLENSMVFKIDDRTVFQFKQEKDDPTVWPFDQRFHLLLNVAVGGNWGGQKGIDNSIFPQTMEIDYVRVSQQ